MNTSPASEFEDSEYQPKDRPAPALKKGEGTPSKSTPALPMRGEIFDVALDENGQIVSDAPPPKRAGAWFFAGLAALFCTYNLGAYVGQKSKVPAPVGPFTSPVEKLKPLRLQIAGRVKKPGVYTLPGGARLEDALQKAGGALPNADLSDFNLADWAVDGSKIQVPTRQNARLAPTPTPVVIIKEVFVTPPQNTPEDTPSESPAPVSQTLPDAKLEGLASRSAATAKVKVKTGKTSESALAALRRNPVDLNKSSVEQLAVLPGVGPKMAERIVAYRRENGGFKSVSDLDNVKGIGEKRMATLQALVKIK